MAYVEHRVSGGAEGLEEPCSRRRGGLRVFERMRAAGKVVLLDVDDDEPARHCPK
jgi:hypothetical protein